VPNDSDDFPLIPHLLLSEEEITNQMISLYKEKYEEGSSPIRDFFEGSQTRNILASTSIEGSQLRFLINLMLKMGYVTYAKGGWLDILGLEYNVLRYSAIHSKGPLLFTYPIDEVETESNFPEHENEPEPGENELNLDNLLYEPIIIPANTYVASSKNNTPECETLEDMVINPGESVIVSGQCVNGGIEGNIGRGKIDTIIDDNDELWDLEVINPQPFIGGEEEEDDEPYRARILLNKQGTSKGSFRWYNAMATNVSGVHDVVFVNQPVGKFTVGIIVNGNSKPAPQWLIDAVVDVFKIDEDSIGGTFVSVKRSNYNILDFKINKTYKTGHNPETVDNTIINDLTVFFNGGTTSTGIICPGFNNGQMFSMNDVYPILLAIPGLASFYIQNPNTDLRARFDEVFMLGEVV